MQLISQKSKFAIVGSGHVATRLVDAFVEAGHKPHYILSKSTSGKELARAYDIPLISEPDDLVEVWLLCLKDDLINSNLRNQFPTNSLVCHTAGSVPIHALGSHSRSGVFYPLQTLSKDRKVDFSKIPICLEAGFSDDIKILEQMASWISNDIRFINSDQRRAAHLAAVFVSNFVNYCYRIGYDLLEAQSVDFSILEPLIQETAEKIKYLNPHSAQTGPAQRGDTNIMESHLKLLNQWPEYQNIYKIISNEIENRKRNGSEKL